MIFLIRWNVSGKTNLATESTKKEEASRLTKKKRATKNETITQSVKRLSNRDSVVNKRTVLRKYKQQTKEIKRKSIRTIIAIVVLFFLQ